MTGANPQPAAAAPPATPADAITAPATPDQARPIWPIALAVFTMAHAAYTLMTFILGVPLKLKMLIALITGFVPIGTANPSLWRLASTVSQLYPLLVLAVIAPAIGLWLRRRWALWVLGSWAVATILFILGMLVMNTWMHPISAKDWLLWHAPGLLGSTWLPAIVIIWIARPTSRRQFGQWVDGALPVPLPIWPVVIGWLSMFHAVTGMIHVASRASRTAIQVVMGTQYSSLPLGTSLADWLEWIWIVVSALMLSLAMAALVVPAMALLKRRPNAARLHVIGAVIVLGSVLAGPILDVLQGFRFGHYWGPSVWSIISDLRPTIYPLFLLFWFLRPGVKREVARWRRPGGQAIIPATSERGS